MKKFFLAILFSLFVADACAQPGPPPSQWGQTGSTIFYNNGPVQIGRSLSIHACIIGSNVFCTTGDSLLTGETDFSHTVIGGAGWSFTNPDAGANSYADLSVIGAGGQIELKAGLSSSVAFQTIASTNALSIIPGGNLYLGTQTIVRDNTGHAQFQIGENLNGAHDAQLLIAGGSTINSGHPSADILLTSNLSGFLSTVVGYIAPTGAILNSSATDLGIQTGSGQGIKFWANGASTSTGHLAIASSGAVSANIGLTVLGSFTATGLVTNLDLVNSATTINGQTCTLGLSCTVTAAASGVVVGTTTVGSGASGRILYDNAGVLGEMTTSGSGTVVALAASPSISALTVTGSFTATNLVGLTNLAQSAANTMLGNWTGSTANVTANAMPSCPDSGGDHLNYVSGTGITCGTGNAGVTSIAGTANQITASGSTGAVTLSLSSTLVAPGWLDASSLRATSATSSGTGVGVELQYTGGAGYVQTFDRSGMSYGIMNVAGSTVNIQPGGSTHATFTSTGMNSTNIGATTPGTGAFSTGSFSSNIGQGTTSPTSYRTGAQSLVTVGAGDNGISIITGASSKGMIAFGNGTGTADGSASNRGKIWYDMNLDNMNFQAGAGLIASPNVVISSTGNVGIGTTTNGGWSTSSKLEAQATGTGTALSGYAVGAAGGGNAILLRLDNTAGTLANFFSTTSNVGSITTNGTLTVYNTTSDMRLKSNVVDLSAWKAERALRAYRPQEYRLRGKPGIGALAQEVDLRFTGIGIDAAALGLITRGDSNSALKEGQKGFRQWQMDSSKMVPFLVEAGIDHADRIKSLEAQVRDLKAENARLRTAQARTDAKVDGLVSIVAKLRPANDNRLMKAASR